MHKTVSQEINKEFMDNKEIDEIITEINANWEKTVRTNVPEPAETAPADPLRPEEDNTAYPAEEQDTATAELVTAQDTGLSVDSAVDQVLGPDEESTALGQPNSGKPAIRSKVKKATGLAVTAAMLTTTVGATFSSPAEIVNSPQYMQPTPIVESFDPAPDADDASEDTDNEEKKNYRGVRDILRQWMLGLPLGIRAVLVLPLYCVGWVILQLLGLLGGALLPGLAHTIVGWLLLFGIVLGSAALLLKTVFPDIPLKKLLTPKRIGGMFIGVGVVWVLCTLISAISPEAAKWLGWLKFGGGLLVAGLSVFRIQKKVLSKKKQSEAA